MLLGRYRPLNPLDCIFCLTWYQEQHHRWWVIEGRVTQFSGQVQILRKLLSEKSHAMYQKHVAWLNTNYSWKIEGWHTPMHHCAALGKILESGEVTYLWCHKRNNLWLIFQQNHHSSNMARCHWLEWRHDAWSRSEADHIWPSTSSPDLSKAIPGHSTWITSHWPVVPKFAFHGVSWCSATKDIILFSHRLA